MHVMNLMVTLDQAYLPYLRPLLQSIYINNPGERFALYLVHPDATPEALEELESFCEARSVSLHPIHVGDELFAEAPVSRYYSKAMYYRLLAGRILPQTLDKVLYLDPDLLVINGLRDLYDTDLGDDLFAAAAHTRLTNISTVVNRIRLNTPEAEAYFNSGVMLLNLARLRSEVSEKEIFDFVRDHAKELLLPDQDVLNALYSDRILALDDSLYNLDPRHYESYYLTSGGERNMDWIMENTVIIHYCGKTKPWMKSKKDPFIALWKHYARQARRDVNRCVR